MLNICKDLVQNLLKHCWILVRPLPENLNLLGYFFQWIALPLATEMWVERTQYTKYVCKYVYIYVYIITFSENGYNILYIPYVEWTFDSLISMHLSKKSF